MDRSHSTGIEAAAFCRARHVDELEHAIRDALWWSREQERIYGRNCAQPVPGGW